MNTQPATPPTADDAPRLAADLLPAIDAFARDLLAHRIRGARAVAGISEAHLLHTRQPFHVLRRIADRAWAADLPGLRLRALRIADRAQAIRTLVSTGRWLP